jgi:tetraacyldisaccharide 4'-kinase
MNFFRLLLFPFSIIYHSVTSVRNALYDKGILKSYSFNIPVIAVGNLSVGGTGKTPQIEYIIRLLSPKYKLATLSRGYKRESKGFILASQTSNAKTIGDEPFQYYKKYPKIQVAVDTNRKNGIEQLLALKNKPDVILLDDAFQHRKVKAGFYILLTSYNDLYINDYLLPSGNLRESRRGATRANIIVVTKCPVNLSSEEKSRLFDLLIGEHNYTQELYFSFIDYDDNIYSEHKSLQLSVIKNNKKLLIAGIAKPAPFFDYLKSSEAIRMTFPDHHNFSKSDIDEIRKASKDSICITTEKDYVRLYQELKIDNLYYLPIKTAFLDDADGFNNAVESYVRKFVKA